MVTDPAKQIRDKVPARLRPLLAGEALFIARAAAGSAIQLDLDDAGAPTLPAQRRIRGEFVAWFVASVGALLSPAPSNLVIRGAVVIGRVDLRFERVGVSIEFTDCTIASGLRADYARLRSLLFRGGQLGQLTAIGVRIEDQLGFDDAVVDGPINIQRGAIGKALTLSHTRIEAQLPIAVLANSLTCETVRIDNATIDGQIILVGATIDGDLDIRGTQVRARDVALNAERAKIKGACYIMTQTAVTGGISFLAAQIGGELNLRHTTIEARPAPALDLRRAVIANSVYLDFARLRGAVTCLRADIRGDLQANGTRIAAIEGEALDLRNAEVRGSVRIVDGFDADRPLTLYGSEIKGELTIDNARIGTDRSRALDARRCTVGGVHLNGTIAAVGHFDFYGTTVKGDLIVNGASTEAELKFSFCTVQGSLVLADSNLCFPVRAFRVACNQLTVRDTTLGSEPFERSWLVASRLGRVEIAQVRLHGGLALRNCAVGDDVALADIDLVDARIDPEHGQPLLLDLSGTTVQGALRWSARDGPEIGLVDLGHARIGTLDVDANCWPERGETRLDGLSYDRITDRSLGGRARWLGLQGSYNSQPYEQLIKTYRGMGDSTAASDIAILKWRQRRKTLPRWSFGRIWDRFLDLASGYGYRPIRPLLGLVAVLIVGSVVFGQAARADLFCPADTLRLDPPCQVKPQYPGFSAPLYSLEMLVPLGDFGQKRTWTVRGDRDGANLLTLYTVLHRALGWIFSLLLALAPTNILRRE